MRLPRLLAIADCAAFLGVGGVEIVGAESGDGEGMLAGEAVCVQTA